MSKEYKEHVDYYLNELLKGNADDAFHGLLEVPDEAVPFIINGYAKLTDSEAKAAIIKVLAERKPRSILMFLERALQDEDKLVWKAAVNALVSISVGESLEILLQAKLHLSNKRNGEFVDWVDEAIKELREDT